MDTQGPGLRRGPFSCMMTCMSNDINDIAARTHEVNQANGYNEYADELAKGQKAANKHLGNKGLLVTSEVTEAQDELRKGHPAWEIYIKDGKLEGYLVESADAIIRLFGDMSEVFEAHKEELGDWTIGDLIKAKIEYNASRSDTAVSGDKLF